MQFRAFLIKILDQLSDTDRQAFHFSVGDNVPRTHRDDCTRSGSLRLLDSLFDQNLISEQNFDYLIDIFEQINCYNVSEQLKEYKLFTVCTSIAEPISPSIDEASFSIEIDKMRSVSNETQRQSSQLSRVSEEPSTVPEHLMIQSSTNTSSDETYTYNRRETKQSVSTIGKVFNTKRSLVSIVILAIIFCISLFCFIFFRSPKIIHSTPSSIVKQELFYIMKEGLQYGNTSLIQNESFNDAKDLGLFYTDRCIGVELQWNKTSLISLQFLYSNNHSSNLSFVQSNDLPFISSQFSSAFMLAANEEIHKINLYENSREMNFNIVGIQFLTTTGRKSELFGSNDGHFLTESFEHYTFGYAKGRQQNDKGIETLQFVWIQQTLATQQIATVARSMVEMCEFTFISNVDSQLVHAKGIESSWFDLKRKFNRPGVKCDSTASYYQKISHRGPILFAIVNSSSVFYHDKNEWYKYRSAGDIRCNIIPRSTLDSLLEL